MPGPARCRRSRGYRAAYGHASRRSRPPIRRRPAILADKGVLENAIVVLLSDHGEALGGEDDSMLGKPAPAAKSGIRSGGTARAYEPEPVPGPARDARLRPRATARAAATTTGPSPSKTCVPRSKSWPPAPRLRTSTASPSCHTWRNPRASTILESQRALYGDRLQYARARSPRPLRGVRHRRRGRAVLRSSTTEIGLGAASARIKPARAHRAQGSARPSRRRRLLRGDPRPRQASGPRILCSVTRLGSEPPSHGPCKKP